MVVLEDNRRAGGHKLSLVEGEGEVDLRTLHEKVNYCVCHVYHKMKHLHPLLRKMEGILGLGCSREVVF